MDSLFNITKILIKLCIVIILTMTIVKMTPLKAISSKGVIEAFPNQSILFKSRTFLDVPLANIENKNNGIEGFFTKSARTIFTHFIHKSHKSNIPGIKRSLTFSNNRKKRNRSEAIKRIVASNNIKNPVANELISLGSCLEKDKIGLAVMIHGFSSKKHANKNLHFSDKNTNSLQIVQLTFCISVQPQGKNLEIEKPKKCTKNRIYLTPSELTFINGSRLYRKTKHSELCCKKIKLYNLRVHSSVFILGNNQFSDLHPSKFLPFKDQLGSLFEDYVDGKNIHTFMRCFYPAKFCETIMNFEKEQNNFYKPIYPLNFIDIIKNILTDVLISEQTSVNISHSKALPVNIRSFRKTIFYMINKKNSILKNKNPHLGIEFFIIEESPIRNIGHCFTFNIFVQMLKKLKEKEKSEENMDVNIDHEIPTKKPNMENSHIFCVVNETESFTNISYQNQEIEFKHLKEKKITKSFKDYETNTFQEPNKDENIRLPLKRVKRHVMPQQWNSYTETLENDIRNYYEYKNSSYYSPLQKKHTVIYNNYFNTETASHIPHHCVFRQIYDSFESSVRFITHPLHNIYEKKFQDGKNNIVSLFDKIMKSREKNKVYLISQLLELIFRNKNIQTDRVEHFEYLNRCSKNLLETAKMIDLIHEIQLDVVKKSIESPFYDFLSHVFQILDLCDCIPDKFLHKGISVQVKKFCLDNDQIQIFFVNIYQSKTGFLFENFANAESSILECVYHILFQLNTFYLNHNKKCEIFRRYPYCQSLNERIRSVKDIIVESSRNQCKQRLRRLQKSKKKRLYYEPSEECEITDTNRRIVVVFENFESVSDTFVFDAFK